MRTHREVDMYPFLVRDGLGKMYDEERLRKGDFLEVTTYTNVRIS